LNKKILIHCTVDYVNIILLQGLIKLQVVKFDNNMYLLHNYFVAINVLAMCSIFGLIFIKPLSRKEWKVYKMLLFNFVLSNTEISTENKRHITATVGVKIKEGLRP